MHWDKRWFNMCFYMCMFSEGNNVCVYNCISFFSFSASSEQNYILYSLYFKLFYWEHISVWCSTLEKRRIGSKTLTSKWLMLYSKYFQMRDTEKNLNQIFIKNTLHPSVACNLYDLNLKNETVRSIYKLFKFMYPSMWVKFDKIEVTQELIVQHISSVKRRQRTFVFTGQSSTLLSETSPVLKFCCTREANKLTHANVSPQWKRVFGMMMERLTDIGNKTLI